MPSVENNVHSTISSLDELHNSKRRDFMLLVAG